MATVTFNGVRLNSGDSNVGWGNFGSGGPAPAAEPQLKYQGTGAVNKKVVSTTSRSGVQYAHGSGQDMATAWPLLLFKMKVADAGDLNAAFGCEAAIGSGSGAYHSFNVSGSAALNDQYADGYNSQGGLAEGYIVTAINPSVAAWRAGTTGAPNLSAVQFFAAAAQFVAGGAKSENVACDAIDIGRGLDYAGSGFSFDDGADTDQGVVANRWGFACRNGSVLTLRGLHRVGAGGAAVDGEDRSTVLFPDGYHGTGDCGIAVDLSNIASDLVVFGGTYTGLGRNYGSVDTRPDFSVTGLLGSLLVEGTLRGFRRVTLNPATQCEGAEIGCAEFVQGGATLIDTTIRCNAAAGQAVATDPGVGLLSGVRWVQGGAGHAIRFTQPGTYILDAQGFEGFGGNGEADAAILNDSGGAVAIIVTGGGSTPTVRNGAGASTTVSNPVTLRFPMAWDGGAPVDFEWRLYEEDPAAGVIGTVELAGAENEPGALAQIVYPYTFGGTQPVVLQVMATGFKERLVRATLTATDQQIAVEMERDTNI